MFWLVGIKYRDVNYVSTYEGDVRYKYKNVTVQAPNEAMAKMLAKKAILTLDDEIDPKTITVMYTIPDVLAIANA